MKLRVCLQGLRKSNSQSGKYAHKSVHCIGEGGSKNWLKCVMMSWITSSCNVFHFFCCERTGWARTFFADCLRICYFKTVLKSIFSTPFILNLNLHKPARSNLYCSNKNQGLTDWTSCCSNQFYILYSKKYWENSSQTQVHTMYFEIFLKLLKWNNWQQ